MERNPHLLIEGCAIGCYAIGAKVAYIYIRGEFFHVQHDPRARDRRGVRAGAFSARTSSASGFDCDVYVHRGAGAYEAGEETALLESLEGKRAQPRNKPPFPAVVGVYGKPTAVNNVETLCNVPLDHLEAAPSGSRRSAPRRTAARSCICVSGHVEAAGRLRSVDERDAARADRRSYAGGVRDGRTLKAVIPGGSSVPILLPDQLDTQASFDGDPEGRLAARLGRRSSSSTTRPAWCGSPRTCCTSTVTSRAASARRAARAPTGCYKILQRIERGEGQMQRSRSAVEHLRQHRRQDAVRVRRRRGDAGADDAEAFPARVRGAHQGRPLHAAGRLAGAASGGSALAHGITKARRP